MRIGSGARQRCLPCQTKVQNLDPAILGNKDVLGFEVAMNDALVVGCCQAIGNLPGVVQGLASRDRSGGHELTQGFAFEELHDGIGDAVLGVEVEDREDIGVREGRDCLGLALETGETLGVVGESLGQDLDGHLTTELEVFGPIDLTHAACTDLLQDFVLAQCRADHRVLPAMLESMSPEIVLQAKGQPSRRSRRKE